MVSVIAPISTVSAQDTTDEEIADLLAELAGEDIDDTANEEEVVVEEPAEEVVEEPAPEQEEVTEEPAPEQEAAAEEETEEHNAAEDILDAESWKFLGDPRIEIRAIEEDSVTIATRVVTYDDVAVKQYKIYYSETPLSDALENFDQIMSKDAIVVKTENNMAEIILDGLTEDKKYYVLVAPIHPTDPTADVLEMISSEAQFKTKAGGPVINTNTRVFESVSYKQEGNTISVTWTPTTIVEKGLLSIKHANEDDYMPLATVMMNQGQYSFTVTEDGTHYLLLHGVDDDGTVLWQEQVSSIKVEAFEQPEEPVVSAPQVGPTTDLIMALLVFGFMVYIVYRFRRVE